MEISVVWFRRDLRLLDNEAVSLATSRAEQTLFVFVIDPWFYTQPEIGWLRVRFLFESLTALDSAFKKHSNRLILLKGESVASISGLLETLKAKNYRPSLYVNHDIQVAYGKKRDDAVADFCATHDIPLTFTHNFFLLHDESKMDSWWRQYYAYQEGELYGAPTIEALDDTVSSLVNSLPQIDPQSIVADMDLTLPEPRQKLFTGGEDAARLAVYSFLKDRVGGYRWKISRPILAQRGATSLLGPHLAFGTISSRTVYQAATIHRDKVEAKQPKKAFDIANYLDRLRWRDSFTQRLWFHPEIAWKNRFPEFDELYNEDPLTDQQQEYFDRWKAGTTGFPLLDAAMRQLKADGFINFRMRAMAVSVLTINCGVSWHHGARYFMNCLVDGDIAINHWQWQMQAGITNPLSPAFRMYSPTKNLKDRDPQAEYVHFWLPETRGKSVDTILKEAEPMLDFEATRKANGKVVADLRKAVRERIVAEKGLELVNAKTAHRVVKNYTLFSTEKYKRYIK